MNYGYGGEKLATGAQCSSTMTEAPAVGELQQIQNRLEEILKRMHANVAHLYNVSDRVLGPVPQPCSDAEGQSKPSTELQRVHELLRGADKLSDMLAGVTDRLSRL
jgi:hypothetical protein